MTSKQNNRTKEKNFVCAVCGDKATGHHYDVISCTGCKSFFRRTVITARQFRCHRDELRCVCRACRFDKCVAVGMNPQMIILDGKSEEESNFPGMSTNQPIPDEIEEVDSLYEIVYRETTHKRKRYSIDLLTELMDCSLTEVLKKGSCLESSSPSSPNPNISFINDEDKNKLWELADVFLTIEFAKTFQEFHEMDYSDKIEMLRSRAPTVVLLMQSFYSLQQEANTAVFPDGTETGLLGKESYSQKSNFHKSYYTRPLEIMKELQLTETEFAMIKSISLFSIERKLSEEAQDIIEKKSKDLIVIFRKHLIQTYGESEGLKKMAQCLLALPNFVDLAEKKRSYLFYLYITKAISFPVLICDTYFKE